MNLMYSWCLGYVQPLLGGFLTKTLLLVKRPSLCPRLTYHWRDFQVTVQPERLQFKCSATLSTVVTARGSLKVSVEVGLNTFDCVTGHCRQSEL